MDNIFIERKKIIKEILDMYCDGKGLTYIAKYIYDNCLIDKINYVIDNAELDKIFNYNSIVALSHIERAYINKYAYIDKTILNHLFYHQYHGTIDSISFDEMFKNLKYIDMMSPRDFENKILRYRKLGLIHISDEICEKLVNNYCIYAPSIEEKKKLDTHMREQRNIDMNFQKKTQKYYDSMSELYKLHCNGMSLEEISNRIPFNAEIFYYDIMNNKEIYDDFTIKIASYKYEMYLRNKYINCLIIPGMESINEICEQIYNKNQFLSYDKLSKKINNYLNLSPVKNKKLEKYLMTLKQNYLTFYKNKRIEKKEETRLKQRSKEIEAYEKVIIDYICSKELDSSKYCEDNNIDIRLFNRALSTLEKTGSKVYDRYCLYTSQYINAKNDRYLYVFYKVMNYIRKGIESTYTSREFDIIDYFEITLIPPVELFNNVKEFIDIEDYTKFVDFISKNPISEPLNDVEIEKIYSSEHIVNAKFNEKGNLIKDSGRIVKLEEKEEAISRLNELNIPINETTYNCMIKRIIKQNDKQIKLFKNNSM